MAWEEANQENPKLTVNTVNQIVWNEAAHEMMVYPSCVDLLYDEAAQLFALIGRMDVGKYRVYSNDDNTYHIECQRALNQMGMKNLAEDYEVTPTATIIGTDPPRFNAIQMPVKPA